MSDLTGLVIREVEPGDEERLLSLIRLVLGPGQAPRTTEMWRWKHQDNPFGASPALIALAGDEIVALRIFLRWRWRLGERTVAAVRAVDTAVHPRWRRRGLFSHLTRGLVDRVSAEGCELVFNTPNRRSGKGYRKLGWQAAAQPPILVRPRRPLRMALALAGGPKRLAPDVSALPQAADLLAWTGFGELLRASIGESAGHLTTARDAAFLRWRYVDVPAFDYRAVWRADSRAAVALVFRSRVRRSMGEVLVVEVLTRGAPESGAQLLGELAVELADSTDADYLLASAAAGTPEGAALRRAGFRRLPLGPTLMTRPLAEDAERLAANAWRLSAGDLEIF